MQSTSAFRKSSSAAPFALAKFPGAAVLRPLAAFHKTEPKSMPKSMKNTCESGILLFLLYADGIMLKYLFTWLGYPRSLKSPPNINIKPEVAQNHAKIQKNGNRSPLKTNDKIYVGQIPPDQKSVPGCRRDAEGEVGLPSGSATGSSCSRPAKSK